MSSYHSIIYDNDTYDAYTDSYTPRRNEHGRGEVDPYADPYETQVPNQPDNLLMISYAHSDPAGIGPDTYWRRRADEGPDRSQFERSNPGSQHQLGYSHMQPAVIPVPSSSYLDLAAQLSSRVDDPTQTRKLLILDLNGTLLFREPRAPPLRRYESWKDRRRPGDRDREADPYANPHLPRPFRPVHPRPYMRSFRNYLFHPETRKWLDTMIWSSAQPHSVKDMVGRCFGKSEVVGYGPSNEESDEMEAGTGEDKNLVAVWARDTLGLDEDAYYKKTQTTKDLSKPWKVLTSSGPISQAPVAISTSHVNGISKSYANNSHSLHSTTVDTHATSATDAPIIPDEDDIPGFPLRRSDTNPDISTTSPSSHASHLHSSNNLLLGTTLSVTPAEATIHSAKTTLLLDDSPLKARMQPYNHVCVPEYGFILRARDVKIADASNNASRDATTSNAETSTSADANVNAGSDSNQPLDSHVRDSNAETECTQQSTTNLMKRKWSLDSPSASRSSSLPVDTIRDKHYDHTLLAIIGLLDTLKYESSVAGWIKAGGLFSFCADRPNASAHATGGLGSTLAVEEKVCTISFANEERALDTEDPELDGIYLASVPEGVEGHDVGTTSDGKNKKERWRKTKKRKVDADGNGYWTGKDPGSTDEGDAGVDKESGALDELGRMVRPTESGMGNDVGVSSVVFADDGIPGLGLAQNAVAPSVRVTSAPDEVLSTERDAGVDLGSGVGNNDEEIVLDPSIVDFELDPALSQASTQPSTQHSAYDGDVEFEAFDNTADVTLASTQPDTDGDIADTSLAVSDTSDPFLPSSPLVPQRSQSLQSVHTRSESQSQTQFSQTTQPASQPSSPILPQRSQSLQSVHIRYSQTTQPASQPSSQSSFSQSSQSRSRLNLAHTLSRNPSLTSLQPTEPSSSAERYDRMKRERVQHLMPRPKRRVPPPPRWGEDANSSFLYKGPDAKESGKTQDHTEGSSHRPPPQDEIPSAFLNDTVFAPRPEHPPPAASSTLPTPQKPVDGSDHDTDTSMVSTLASDLSSSAKSEPIVRDFAYEKPHASASSRTRPPSKVSHDINTGSLPPLWYQHPPARWYWVRRGIAALEALGLEVVPGVDVD